MRCMIFERKEDMQWCINVDVMSPRATGGGVDNTMQNACPTPRPYGDGLALPPFLPSFPLP